VTIRGSKPVLAASTGDTGTSAAAATAEITMVRIVGEGFRGGRP
jgi:threonine synthase